jgi:hypothetical protein
MYRESSMAMRLAASAKQEGLKRPHNRTIPSFESLDLLERNIGNLEKGYDCAPTR